ncbi:TRAFAC clade GTPase domain-containing protein [Kitasatospora purpeofusca]|uniref:TRAFAC clade GTPase domain-containing protein n=1 Tax=Kitasatospora purpeofusca TaxID=67352 RepID=UPI003F4ADE8A
MDLTQLRLVALGHSSAGKSSCLAAMYTRLAVGRKGFRLVSADNALAHQLTTSGKLLGRGIYPPPSSRRTELSAGLEFGRRAVLGFEWTDYRGGALTGSAADDPETAQLLERLTHADAVVVFADTQRLATDPESQDEVRRTVVLLHRAVDEQPTPLPVVLVYTKADLVTDPADWARVRAAAAPLEELLVSGGRVRGTAVAVSCGTSTRGVAVPVLWCLSTLLTHRAEEVARSLGTTKALIKNLRKEANGIDSMVSWFKGVESAAKRLKHWEGVGREEKAELARLGRPARRLARLLDSEQRGTVPPSDAPARSAAR